MTGGAMCFMDRTAIHCRRSSSCTASALLALHKLAGGGIGIGEVARFDEFHGLAFIDL
jgi:hypothetical protein